MVGIYKISFIEHHEAELNNYTRLIHIRSESYDPVAAFYSELKMKNWKKFLYDSLTSLDGAYEPNGIRWEKGPVNEEGFVIQEDEICFIGFSGEKSIKKDKFHSLNLHYAHKCLEAVTWFNLIEKELITQDWVEDIRKWIIQQEATPPSA